MSKKIMGKTTPFFMVQNNWDAQTCITVKENNVSKIVATLNRLAESYTMVELQAILS